MPCVSRRDHATVISWLMWGPMSEPSPDRTILFSPVPGGWSHWSPWSWCDRSCGGGRSLRSRSCSSPPPKNGGASCVGERLHVRSCNPMPCGTTVMTATSCQSSLSAKLSPPPPLTSLPLYPWDGEGSRLLLCGLLRKTEIFREGMARSGGRAGMSYMYPGPLWLKVGCKDLPPTWLMPRTASSQPCLNQLAQAKFLRACSVMSRLYVLLSGINRTKDYN